MLPTIASAINCALRFFKPSLWKPQPRTPIEMDSNPLLSLRSASPSESHSSQTLPSPGQRIMPIWSPPGGIKESPARWDANPERCTFFLQCLIDARTDGKFSHAPTVAAYVDISRNFWVRYNVYHTPKQLKNYYQKCKSFWSNISWARGCTGIGWDDEKKMILASPEWWEANQVCDPQICRTKKPYITSYHFNPLQERKGIVQLRGRPIVDFDLLHTLYASGRVEARYAQSPYAPMPLTSDEGSGDSDKNDNSQFFDPLITQPPQAGASFSTSSGQKRMADSLGNRLSKQKKKRATKVNTLSPMTTKVTHFCNVYMDVKERRRRINLEQEVGGEGTPIDVEEGQPSPIGVEQHTPSQSNAINSPSYIQKCIHVLRHVLKLPVRSELYQDGSDLLAGSRDLQWVFLELNDPTEQLYWLERRVQRPRGDWGGITRDGGRGVTHPPGFHGF